VSIACVFDFSFLADQKFVGRSFPTRQRGNGTAEAEDCGAGQWRKSDRSIRACCSQLLFLPVFLAGWTCLYPVLVYMLASLPKSLSGCSSGFALGKTSWKEKLY